MGRKVGGFYAARIAHEPGIYASWAETEKQVKGVPGSGGGNQKKFRTNQEAMDFFCTDADGRSLPSYNDARAYWKQQSEMARGGAGPKLSPKDGSPACSTQVPVSFAALSSLAMGRKSGGFYAARIAHEPGIYESWAEAERQVKGVPSGGSGNQKKFRTSQEAMDFFCTDADGRSLPGYDDARAYWKRQSEMAKGGAGPKLSPEEPYFRQRAATPSGRAPPSSEEAEAEAPPHSDAEVAAEDLLEGLDPQQRHIFRLIREGRSIVVTGGAGVGKTFLTGRIRSWLQRKYGANFRHKVAVTAATGLAATHVDGVTLHSAVGVGVPKTVSDFGRLWGSKLRRRLWLDLEILLIDEASMVSGEFMDRLAEEVRELRQAYGQESQNSGEMPPFGGIQAILIGDFLQLLPIPGKLPPDAITESDGRLMLPTGNGKDELFLNRGAVYQSDFFKAMDFTVVELQTVHRQKRDANFAHLLNRLREGRCDDSELEGLNGRCLRPLSLELTPLVLQGRNADVDKENARRLDMLPGEAAAFRCVDSTVPDTGDAEAREALRRSAFWHTTLAAEELELKVGAQVMLLANLDQRAGLVNGSLGKVCRMEEVPLRDVLEDAPKERQWLSANSLLGPGPRHSEGPGPDGVVRLPVVRFNGRKGSCHRIGPWTFRCDVPGAGQCRRVQLPLKLGWAVTHHKAQGCTVDVAKGNGARVDPDSFTQGQAYVALSRVTEEAGLELLKPVRRQHIRVSQVALSFYVAVRAVASACGVLPEKLSTMGPRAALAEATAMGHPSAAGLREGLAQLDALGTWRQIRPRGARSQAAASSKAVAAR